MNLSITESRDYVLKQARENIEMIKANPGYTSQAKQVNASLASIVAMERNAVMLQAIENSRNAKTIANREIE